MVVIYSCKELKALILIKYREIEVNFIKFLVYTISSKIVPLFKYIHTKIFILFDLFNLKNMRSYLTHFNLMFSLKNMHEHPSEVTYILYIFNFSSSNKVFYNINSMHIQLFSCTWVSTLLLNFSIIIAVMSMSFNY